jgi:hypothetical protein
MLKNAVFLDEAHCVSLVKTDVSEERVASIFRVEEITLATTSSLVGFCQTHIPEGGIFPSHHRQNLKSYNGKCCPQLNTYLKRHTEAFR